MMSSKALAVIVVTSLLISGAVLADGEMPNPDGPYITRPDPKDLEDLRLAATRYDADRGYYECHPKGEGFWRFHGCNRFMQACLVVKGAIGPLEGDGASCSLPD